MEDHINNSNLCKAFITGKSELLDKAIFIPILSTDKKEEIKDNNNKIENVENYLLNHWHIYGEEFSKKIKALFFILKLTFTEEQSQGKFNFNDPNKNKLVDLQIALTLLTSLFERFLGDILYTQLLNEAKIPFLFKDLIVQPELIRLWQKNPSSGIDPPIKTISSPKHSNLPVNKNKNKNKNNNKNMDVDLDPLTLVLILLFGGPNYLNIRNLLWHGFVITPFTTSTTSASSDSSNMKIVDSVYPFPIIHYFQLIWTVFVIVFNRIKKSLEYQYHLKNHHPNYSVVLPCRSFSNSISNDQFIFDFGKYLK
jgi:hypothetical protein